MGESIQQLKDQLNEYWQSADRNKRIKIIVIGIITILTIIILSLALTRTSYETLYRDLSLEDMGEIIEKLDELGIEWKTADDDPKTIMVPTEQKNEAKIKLASEGLPKDGYSFIDAFNDSSWTMTDSDKRERMKLALQSELASTISEIEGIKEATVYINEEEDTGFVLEENKNEPSASVFIERSSNRLLTGETISAIQNLIASSINMNPEEVQIIDNEGKLLTSEEDQSEILLTDQYVIKHSLENKVNDSISKLLENIFGPGNVDVRSSVRMNFDSKRTTIVEFSPPVEGNEEGLIRSMEEVEEHMVGGTAQGIPGTEENVEDYAMNDESQEGYDKSSRIINYELNEINQEIQKAPGQVEDITVAVLVNSNIIHGELTEEVEDDIKNLIYAATGLDTKQVEVMAGSFVIESEDEIQNVEDAIEMNWPILLTVLVGATMIAGLTIYRKRKKRELQELEELKARMESEREIQEEVEDLEFETEKSKVKAQIDKFVDKNPESVAQLLRSWLNE